MTLHEQLAAPVTRLRERIAYANRFITVYDDDVRFSDGRDGQYLRIVQSDGKPGVVMLPLCGDHVAMVRVFRYPAGEWEWGLPRGLAHGDDPEATARLELTEELGAAPARLAELGPVAPDSGLLASVVHVFGAEYDSMPAAPQDTTEVSAVRWWPVRLLLGAITAGQIRDGFTLAAVCYGMCWRLLPAGVLQMPAT